ncbi:oxidoreductase [Streptomyces sp. NPDC002073]
MDLLLSPLTFPNGSTVGNRMCKAAMEESLAEKGQLPGERVLRLYRRWARGGAGLQITGNVMVDRRALTSPGTIVLDGESPLEPFVRWAEAAKSRGTKVWMQINHPGRQVGAEMPGVSLAPSAVPVSLGRHSHRFARPTAMTESDILATIERFAATAQRAEAAGFDGVQIHAAHGYLLSQFLSPLVNLREDDWGGSLENRARLLVEVVKAVRASVSSSTAVSIKINSSDFQRGGFETSDAVAVLGLLEELRVDLVELSGGTVESPVSAVLDGAADERTLAREARFMEMARQLVDAKLSIPLMLTGGIARRPVAETVLAQGFSMVGMASALATSPDLPLRWATDEDHIADVEPVTWSDKSLRAAAHLAIVRRHLRRTAEGRPSRPGLSPVLTFLGDELRRRKALHRYRSSLAETADTSNRH